MKSWYAIRAAAESGAEILIYDEIGAFGVTAKSFAEDLKALDGTTTITVRLNSPGGSVFDGLAIYNTLKRHSARKIVAIDGLAASIASVIAMAGDEIVMPENAMLMIHDPGGMVAGTAGDMRAMADALDRIKGGLVSAYRDKTGQADGDIERLMKEETWMTAAEAVAMGFADRIDKPIVATASFDLSRFKHPPEALGRGCSQAKPDDPPPHRSKEIPMTDSIVKPADPPAAASAAADAVPAPTTAEIENRTRANALSYAREVVDLCALAGVPQRAAEFLARAAPLDDVRRLLLDARAATDANSVIDGQRETRRVTAPTPDGGWGDVIARLFPKKKES